MMRHVLDKLRNKRIVDSVRGSDGGCRPVSSPFKITVCEVMEATEGTPMYIQLDEFPEHVSLSFGTNHGVG